MKFSPIILMMMAFTLCHFNVEGSQSGHHHKRSLREIVKKIEKIDSATLNDVNNVQTTVNNIQTTVNGTQTTVNGIQTSVNGIQTTDNEILSIVSTLSPSCAITITTADLPLTINTPGLYNVCGDLLWQPTGPNQVAITVNSNDVVINFGGYALTQVDPTQADCIGLLVNQNFTHLQFLNGTIQKISSYGTVVLGGVTEILFDGLNNNYCGYYGTSPLDFSTSGGMGFSGTDIDGNITLPISDVMIRNCNFNFNNATDTVDQAQLSGCLLFLTNQVTIQNCQMNNNTYDTSANPAAEKFLIPLALLGCNDVLVDNCMISNNVGLGSASTQAFIFVDDSNNLVFTNNQISDNSGTGFQANVGLSLQGNNAVIDHCVFQNFTVDGTDTSQSLLHGLDIIGDNVVVRNSSFQNFTSNTKLYGILAQGVNNVIENCSIQDFTSTSNSAFYGILAEGVNNVIDNCNIQDFTSATNSAFYGIFAYGNNFVIDNCSIQNFTSTGSPDTIGIYSQGRGLVMSRCFVQEIYAPSAPSVSGMTFSGEYMSIENCKVQNLSGQSNTIGFNFANIAFSYLHACQASSISSFNDVANTDTISAGFWFEIQVEDILVKDCVAQSIFGTLPSGGAYGVSAGFLATGTLNSLAISDIIFEGCVAQNVVLDSPLAQFTGYGFYASKAVNLSFVGCTCDTNLLFNTTSTGFGLGSAPSGVPATNCILKGNLAFGNNIGFVDNSGATGLKANVFFQNNANDNQTGNYVSMPAGTPIRVWNLSGGTLPPNSGISDLDNISIQ